MFQKALKKLREATERKAGVRVKDDDLDIMEVICTQGKQKQYKLEKNLKERQKGIAHSTVTGKLKRLSEYGFIRAMEETDGFTYYELTPFGLSSLMLKGRVDISTALTHFEKNQKEYFEALVHLHPQLIDRLKKHPPWFVTQLTPDLWVIYYIAKRSELRKQTLKLALALSKGDTPEPPFMQFEVQPLCVHRIEVEGKGICVKQQEKCIYRPREVAKCPILKQQMLKELEKLEKH